MTRKEATNFISSVKAIRENATDAQASLAPDIYPTMHYSDNPTEASLIKAGTRINWNGTIKRASVDLWDTELNNPDNAPDLWEDIDYKNGIRIIPQIITTGTAFSSGEKGYWGDDIYESIIDNNVWTPDAYPAGWRLVN